LRGETPDFLCPHPKVDRQRLALGGGVEYLNYVVT